MPRPHRRLHRLAESAADRVGLLHAQQRGAPGQRRAQTLHQHRYLEFVLERAQLAPDVRAHQVTDLDAIDVRQLAVGRRISEERRVGKECGSTCRSRWSPYHYKQKTAEYTKSDKSY